jgi:hypothetical protein
MPKRPQASSFEVVKLDLLRDSPLRSKLAVTLLSRTHRFLRASVALALLVTGWGLPLSRSHLADDDLLCTAGGGVAWGATARIDAAHPGRAPQHCVICHAARTFRSDLADATPIAIGLLRENAPAALARAPYLRSSLGRLPARAPPLA